jgi:transcriptional regulator with XRE-family HTH domain
MVHMDWVHSPWRLGTDLADFADEVRRFMVERGMSLRGLARAAGYDPSHLSKILNGHKPASPYVAGRLDDALQAGGTIRAAVSSAPVAAVRRKEGAPGRLPRDAVTPADVEAVAVTTKAFRDLDNRFGGAHTHRLVAGYLESGVALMLRTGAYTEETGRQLFGAAAQLAHLAAWTAYDMDDHRRPELYFSKALELASAAGDHAFAAEILAARSHRAIHLGIPERAIELARASRHSAARTGLPVLLAEAHELEANGHALLGDGQACAASLHECERAFGRSCSAAMPSWLEYFDRAYLAARFAHTLRDLGDWGEAERYALEASAMIGGLARARAFNTAVLATAYVETDLDQALDAGREALVMAAGLQSGRVVRYLADLRRRLRRRYGSDPKVRSFDGQVSETLGSR